MGTKGAGESGWLMAGFGESRRFVRWRAGARMVSRALCGLFVVGVLLLLSVPWHEYLHCFEIWWFSPDATCRTEYWNPLRGNKRALLGGVYDVPTYSGNALVHGLIHVLSKGPAFVAGFLAFRWVKAAAVQQETAEAPSNVVAE